MLYTGRFDKCLIVMHLEFLYRLEMDNLIADISVRQVKVSSTNHTVV